jgi:hypothetical protein
VKLVVYDFALHDFAFRRASALRPLFAQTASSFFILHSSFCISCKGGLTKIRTYG